MNIESFKDFFFFIKLSSQPANQLPATSQPATGNQQL